VVVTFTDAAGNYSTCSATFTVNPSANTFLAVKITTLPGAGSLKNKSAAVSAGQFVSVTDINQGRLKFTPAANASGSPYTAFTFQVQDNGGTTGGGVDLDPSPNTMTIQITPVNDPPTWTTLPPSGSLTIDEGQFLTFAVQANPNDAGQTVTYRLVGHAARGRQY